MSSFVISKIEYIKAAGVVAGIAEASSAGSGIHQLWVYDYETGRNSTAADYYRGFVRCFEMNALSVAEQYGDSAPETDGSEYRTEFNKAVKTGKCFYMEGGNKLKKNDHGAAPLFP